MLDPDPIPQAAAPNNDVARLFEEFLDARDAGLEFDVEELYRRAGDRAHELRKRIRIVHELRALSDALPPESAPPPEPDLIQLGRFRNLVHIGRGGQADVFRAYDPKLDREIVLKVLRSGLSRATGDARELMMQEGRALARLEHPGIVRVLEIDEAEGRAYIAMEYVRGPSLHAVLEALRSQARSQAGARDSDDDLDTAPTITSEGETKLIAASAVLLEPIAARCRLILGIARALECCHAHDIVHRDIKPSNVLLERGAEPRLIDFGLAHNDRDQESSAHVTQQLVGTPAYLSPEQIEGQRTLKSPKSDQWSLGVMLYELLTLEHPFLGETRSQTLDRVTRAQPTPPRKLVPAIPADLERICLHALARSPDGRYESIAAFAADLEAFLEHRAISIEPPSVVQLARLWFQRNRRDVSTAAIGLACVVAIGLGWFVYTNLSERAATRDAIAALKSEALSLETQQDFRTQFAACNGLRVRALAWDGRFIARMLRDHYEPDVHGAIVETSNRLATVYAEQTRALGPNAPDGQRLKLLRDWRPILAMEEDACPDCDANLVERNRGRAVMPPVPTDAKVVLWRYQLGDRMNTEFVDVSNHVGLIPAVYRYRETYDNGNILETDFCIREIDEELRIKPVVPSKQLVLSMVGVKQLEFHPFGPKYQPLRTDPFLISPKVVSWSDFKRIMPEIADASRQSAQSTSTDGIELGDDDPATVPWRQAFECAARVGARLPTVAEIILALREAAIQAPNHPGILGEWSSMANNASDDERLAVPYKQMPQLRGPFPTPTPLKEDGGTWQYAFRFVLSTPR